MDYSGCKVVVTGADGFIGSHLVEALVGEGADVTALALYNSFDRYGWLDDLAPDVRNSIRLVRGDVRDLSFMLRLFAKQELCFHLAALIAIPHSYDAPQSYVDVNVTGTLNVLEAARANTLTRVVHTSTSETYGTALATPMDEKHPLQAQSPYSASKIAGDMMAEAYARSFDLPVLTLRPFNTFGPRQSERAVIASLIRQALDPSCEAIAVGDLSPLRDFTYVEDAARAFLAIGQSRNVTYGEVYNGGTGIGVSIQEMLDEVRGLIGTNKPVVTDAARFRPEKSEVRALLADNRKLTAATGWKPMVSFKEGLTRTIAWWQERLRSGHARFDARYMT